MKLIDIGVRTNTADKIVLHAVVSPDEGHGTQSLYFEWHGGEYIEVKPHFMLRPMNAFEVINVWDYAAGKPRIEFVGHAMMHAVLDWVADYDYEDMHAGIDSACPKLPASAYR